MNASQLHAVAFALYARGGPGGGSGASAPARAGRAAAVLERLREADPASPLAAAEALEHAYCWEEASVLRYVGRLAWAQDILAQGQALTLSMPCYPVGWRQRLGASAPPALHRRGLWPECASRAIAVVGGRELAGHETRFAAQLARMLLESGRCVVSGGARGADRVALGAAVSASQGGACAIEILPCGLDSADASAFYALPEWAGSRLAVASPEARFRSALAMERNTLVYSFGVGTVVVGPRLGIGGTWHGAREALRRRLGPVGVYLPDPVPRTRPDSSGDLRLRGARALVALGATPLRSPAEALAWVEALSADPLRLRSGSVAEPTLWFA